jgi:hypothetical protein
VCRSIQIWKFVMRRYRACWVRTAVPSACLNLSFSAQYFRFFEANKLDDHVFAERTLHSIIKLKVYQFCSDIVRSFFIVKFEGCKIANILKTCNLAILDLVCSEMWAECADLRHFYRFSKCLFNNANALPFATFLRCKIQSEERDHFAISNNCICHR